MQSIPVVGVYLDEEVFVALLDEELVGRTTEHMVTRIAESVRSHLAALAAEDQLLIRCSRTHLDEETRRDVLRLLSQPLDWTYILEASIRHNVTPLFYQGLVQALPAEERERLVPSSVLAELRRLYETSRARNDRLYNAVAEIADAFERAGVAVMGLKDAQLACAVYPEPGMRPMGDIDLLIHHDDYPAAAACLRRLGFIPQPNSETPYKLKYAWAHFFRRPTDNTWIDLQWNVVQREWDVYHEGNFDFEIDRLWQGAQWMTCKRGAIRVPKPEDMLLHLCQHLEGHVYSELVLFCDIAEFLRFYGDQLDWPYITALAEKYEAQGTLYYILYLVQRLFQAHLPEGLLPTLAPSYFQANLFLPLYDSLSTLHNALDEIWWAAHPPATVMRQFEKVVRREAIGAMQTFRTLHSLATLFQKKGGRVTLYDGVSSERTWPDPALPAFQDIDCLILQDDLPLMRQALSEAGFVVRGDHGAERYAKEWPVVSADPVVDSPTTMDVQILVETRPEALIVRQQNRATAKDTALKSLRSKLLGYRADDATIAVPIRLYALSAEDLALHLAGRLGLEANPLFVLTSLLELLRRYQGELNWQQVMRLGQQYGLERQVCRGTAILAAFTEDRRVPPGTCTGEPVHILQRARYSVTWGRYGAFRNTYFSLFSLLSIKSWKERIGYLIRHPLLPQLATSTVAFLRHKPPTARDLAYWIDRMIAEETETR